MGVGVKAQLADWCRARIGPGDALANLGLSSVDIEHQSDVAERSRRSGRGFPANGLRFPRARQQHQQGEASPACSKEQ
jgi:hypothetical protein